MVSISSAQWQSAVSTMAAGRHNSSGSGTRANKADGKQERSTNTGGARVAELLRARIEEHVVALELQLGLVLFDSHETNERPRESRLAKQESRNSPRCRAARHGSTTQRTTATARTGIDTNDGARKADLGALDLRQADHVRVQLLNEADQILCACDIKAQASSDIVARHKRERGHAFFMAARRPLTLYESTVSCLPSGATTCCTVAGAGTSAAEEEPAAPALPLAPSPLASLEAAAAAAAAASARRRWPSEDVLRSMAFLPDEVRRLGVATLVSSFSPSEADSSLLLSSL